MALADDAPAWYRRDAWSKLLFVFALGICVSVSAALADAPAPPPRPEPYTWIFNGVLPATSENFSGTLVAGPTETEFELLLGLGVTCDGARLEDEVGVVKLHELSCSDGRKLRAQFVAEGGTTLRVFGTIGDEEFICDAHLLDLDEPLDAAGHERWPPALPPVPKQPISVP